MPLDTTLADITARLRKNGFPNKQAISQGIVLRVLSELGWDTYEPAVVWPEYQTRGGRADFALCHPPSKPAIFIEVKHVGGAEGAVQQALHYASHCSVPFVVLTDGRTWSFYLPAEQGDYDDRRVCKLDLYERAAGEAAETFRCYLTQRNVTSGKALGSARTEYRNRKRRSQAKAAIPEAWRELVHKRDSRLLEILADAVESKIGFPPDAGDVREFLAGAAAPRVAREPVTIPSIPSPTLRPAQAKDTEPTPEQLAERRSAAAKERAASRRTTARNSLVIRGTPYRGLTAKDAMVAVLRKLAGSDPSFLERFAQHPDVAGRKRRYIGRTLDELYPSDRGAAAAGSVGRKSWRNQYEKLPGGWLVATHMSNDRKRRIIDQAAETAGWHREDIVLPF